MNLPTSTELPHASLLRDLLADPYPTTGVATSCWADPSDGTIFGISRGDTETRVWQQPDGVALTHRIRGGRRLATFLADDPTDIERYLLITNFAAIGNRAHGTSDPWLADPFYHPRVGVQRRYDDDRQAWAIHAGSGRGMVLGAAADSYLTAIALAETADVAVDDLAADLTSDTPDAARHRTAAESRPWTEGEFSDELTALGRRIGFPVEHGDKGTHLFRWEPRPDVRHLLPEVPPRFTYRLRLLPRTRIAMLGSVGIGFRGDDHRRQLGFDIQALLMPLGQYVAASGWQVNDPLWARALRGLIPKR